MSEWVPKNDHIVYLEVKRPSLLTDFLLEHSKLSRERIVELLHLGSIHVNNKRAEKDFLLRPKDVLRVHLYPKRYPVEEIKWKNVLLHETDNYVVLNKPARIPVPPTVDNIHDNVLNAFSHYYGKTLHITQRLDRGTTGILIFAKNKTFQSTYNKLLLDNQIAKKYVCLTENPVPLGTQIHYLSDSTKIPKEVLNQPQDGFKEAKLIVEATHPITYQAQTFYESRIQLLTGRTHQIRAQLAHLGSPLLGDRTYGGREVAGFTFESFALHAVEVQFLGNTYTAPPSWKN